MNASLNSNLKSFLPLLVIFILASVLPVVFPLALLRFNINQSVVIIGNLILFFVAAVSFIFYRKALKAGNTHVFLRYFYSGMLIKFMACLIAFLVYVLAAGNKVNKGAVLCLMALYMVYTFLEIALLMKQSKHIKLNRNA